MSQALSKRRVPVGSNWAEQVAGSVTTTTGLARCASTSAGLTDEAMRCEPGK